MLFVGDKVISNLGIQYIYICKLQYIKHCEVSVMFIKYISIDPMCQIITWLLFRWVIIGTSNSLGQFCVYTANCVWILNVFDCVCIVNVFYIY